MHLFAYGTLMDADIMTEVSGDHYRSQEATLAGYVRKTVRGEVYPAIASQAGSSVDGVIYFDVSAQAFERLDIFEGELYSRNQVVVAYDNDKAVTVFAYVIAASEAHRLSTTDWSFEEFQNTHKPCFYV
jgi:gamma-glutamylcyclotransferase (GGCT)/AIG2-like uncharacterized protein YtfP